MAENQKPRKVLILFAHPDVDDSRVNWAMAGRIRNLPGVTFHDLYAVYPDFVIDVRAEQELLLQHQLIVFHHPFYWYSCPAILKEWQDRVLLYGFAYGRDGNALKDKDMISVLSTGGPEKAYSREGYNYYTIEELITPFAQTARLCKMHYHKPFIIQDTFRTSTADITTHVEKYHNLISNYIESGQFTYGP